MYSFTSKTRLFGYILVASLVLTGAVVLAESAYAAVQVTFEQCANDRSEGAGVCDWIGSILQSSNSVYFEGMSVPQRLLYRGVANGSHTISFDYSYTKGGIHAYDFITSLNQGNGSFSPGIGNINYCQGLAGPDLTACNAFNPAVNAPHSSPSIPSDSYDSKDSAPVPGTGTSQSAKEAAYEGTFGDRKMSIYTTGTIVGTPTFSPITHDVAANADTADSDATLVLNLTLSGCGGSGCNVLIYFGGHLAQSGDDSTTDSNWGPGLGSSNISGGPYHVKNVELDGGGGSLDNQIQGADILLPDPTLTVIKHVETLSGGFTDRTASEFTVSVKNGGVDVDGSPAAGSETGTVYNLAPGTYVVSENTPFPGEYVMVGITGDCAVNGLVTLAAGENKTCTITNEELTEPAGVGGIVLIKQTIPDGDLISEFIFTGSVASGTISDGEDISVFGLDAGTYTSTEVVPAGWEITDITCEDGESETPSSGNISTGVVTFNVDGALGNEETVVCTVTNTKLGSISGMKFEDENADSVNAVDPADDGLIGWTINLIDAGDGSLVTSTVTDADGNYSFTNLLPGSYRVCEVSQVSWTQTAPVAGPIDIESCENEGTLGYLVSLTAGENETGKDFGNVSFGSITIVKQTLPDGDSQVFDFNLSYGDGDADLSDGQSDASGDLSPGVYTVSETVPAGWDLTSATCSDGSLVSAISLDPGEDVTCTFTNTKRARIIIQKNAIRDSSQEFTFNNNFGNGNPASFGLVDDSTPGLPSFDAEVIPGTYAVTEDPVVGWQSPESTSCDGGETVDSIDVAPGETVTCTFVNEELATIILVKNTVGGDGAFDFIMTGVGLPAGAQLTTVGGTDSESFLNLDPDNTYTISETVPAGWDLTLAECSGTNTPASVTPDAGETVTCTFTNEADAHIIVVKQTDPDGDQTSFEFDPSYGANFFLSDGQQNDSGDLDPGIYSVAELTPAGWDLTNTACASSFSGSEDAAAIDLEAGETVTCTFTNQKDANIVVVKQTIPDGAEGVFDFDLSYGDGDADLSDGQSDDSGDLDPGTYSVSENVPAGWDLTSATCSSTQPGEGSTPGNISLEAGETVTCTFENTQRGTIIVEKQTLPDGSSQSFDFTASYDNDGFALVDDGQNDSGFLVPGNYSVAETGETGWDLTSAICSDQSDPASISLQAGETVTCVFTNTQRGSITIEKQTVPDGDLTEFTFTGDVSGILQDGETASQEVVPGSYNSSETVPTGWILTDVTCDDNDSAAFGENGVIFNVAPGEEVKCTFTNNHPGAQIDVTPLEATNRVGDNHVVTATVQVHNGNGTYVNAPDGTVVTFSLVNNTANAIFIGSNTCVTVGGSCDITINATQTGSVDIHAASDPVELEIVIHVETDGTGDNSVDGEKAYVNARISIDPTEATNPVGDDHDFTVTVEQDLGDGNGFVAFENAIVDVDVSPAPDGGLNETDCTDGTNASGQCVATINSFTPDVFTATAETTISVDGVLFNLVTDGNAENSGPATKTYEGGKIIVQKVTVGGDGNFDFERSWNVSQFILAHGQNEESGFLAPGAYSVEELAEAGWDLTDVSCDDDEGTNPRTNPVSLTLDAGETITCTFTNTQRGHIIVDKITVGGDALFAFVAGGGTDPEYTDFNLMGADAANDQELKPGNYSVSESDLAGWSLQGVECGDGVDNDMNPQALVLNPGATINCTFTNVKLGKIIVEKQTNPDGDSQVFAFTAEYDGDGFNLSDGQTNDSGFTLLPGEYTVAETVPAGWDLDSVTCDDQSDPSAIDLQAGETVTCVFTNEKDANIVIVKETNPDGDPATFEFAGSWPNGLDIFLNDGESADSGDIDPGTYSVQEFVPPGWQLVSSVCDGTGNTPANISLDAGETVTCTFTNEKLAKVTIVKDADPQDCQDFAFAMTGQAGFLLDDSAGVQDCLDTDQPQSKTFNNLSPNVDVTVTETTPNQFWKLDSVTCVNTVGGASYPVTPVVGGVTIDLTPGADVTCTFQNDKISPTRTQGFWQTHYTYALQIFSNPPNVLNGFSANSMLIGDGALHKGPVETIGKVFGAFWSNIAKKSTGQQRTALEKARMQLLQQLVAAKLNCAAFGCTAGVQTMIANADAAFAGNNTAAILTAAVQMDAYNNSGDTIIIGNAGKADPKTAKGVANYAFWDTP